MIEPMERIEDGDCDVCRRPVSSCHCPECKTCGAQGCPGCAPSLDKLREAVEGVSKLVAEIDGDKGARRRAAEILVPVEWLRAILAAPAGVDAGLREALEYARSEAAAMMEMCDEIIDLSKPDVKRWMEKVRDKADAALAARPHPEEQGAVYGGDHVKQAIEILTVLQKQVKEKTVTSEYICSWMGNVISHLERVRRPEEQGEATDLALVDGVLKSAEFSYPGGKCPLCAGWNMGPNGETPRRHIMDCPMEKAIAAMARLRSRTPSQGGANG